MSRKEIELKMQIGISREEAEEAAKIILKDFDKGNVPFLANIIENVSLDNNIRVKDFIFIESCLKDPYNFTSKSERICAINCALAIKNFY